MIKVFTRVSAAFSLRDREISSPETSRGFRVKLKFRLSLNRDQAASRYGAQIQVMWCVGERTEWACAVRMD